MIPARLLTALGGPANAPWRVAFAVTVLDVRRRQVILLRFWDGLSCQKIGDWLGLSKSRIEQVKQQALTDLRTALGINAKRFT